MTKKFPAIRLGIIGFGNIGRQHFEAAEASPFLEVTAIADSSPFHGRDSIQMFGQWEALLRQNEIDAVSICVPHYLHTPIAAAALDAGKHVLLEKPLGLNAAEGRSLIEAAKRNQKTLMAELTHRFYPAMHEARTFVRNGLLGEIYAVEDRIIEAANSQIKPWLKDKSLAGGGVALTNGIHMVDRIAAITGQNLKFVAGRAGCSFQLGDVEDTATMLFTLENGAPVQTLASWPLGHQKVDDELTVYGTKGTLRVWAWRGWRFEPSDGDRAQEHFCYAPEESMHARIQSGVAGALEEFALAIHKHREPVPSATAALNAQLLIEEFYQYTGNNKIVNEDKNAC